MAWNGQDTLPIMLGKALGELDVLLVRWACLVPYPT